MSPKPDVTAERTEQIILAAMDVFARLGFAEARMEDIADAAGLSKGTLYLYFDSKDDVIRGILGTFIGRELDAGREAAAGPGPVIGRLISLADVMAADLVEIEPFTSLYLEFLALALRREPVRTEVRAFFGDFMEILIPLIREGVENGELRQVDPQEAALSIGAMFEGMILLKVYAPDQVDLKKHLLSGLSILLEGLRSPGSGRAGKLRSA